MSTRKTHVGPPVKRPTPRPPAAPPPPGLERHAVPSDLRDAATLAIFEGARFADTTDVHVARLQGVDAALASVARVMPGALPKGRPSIVKSVIRDENGRITHVIEENAMIRETP
jgi:hypothetical protein